MPGPIFPGEWGGEGENWFVVEVTSEPYIQEQPGDRGTNWFALEVTSEPYFPGEPEIEPGIVGGGRRFTFGPITPHGQEVEFEFPVEIGKTTERELVSYEFSAEVAASRSVEFALGGHVVAERSVEFLIESARGPAANLNLLLADDDDVLALIA